MTAYYLDASALVKYYLLEAGSRWISDLLDYSLFDRFFSIELITVEVMSALSRAQREKRIGLNLREKLSNRVWADARTKPEVIGVRSSIVDRAAQLSLMVPLRAYDAMHLSAALELGLKLTAAGLPAPIFVSADANLLAAARAEGLMAENPNEHE
jgi:predicted nucleic acid-binding protein